MPGFDVEQAELPATQSYVTSVHDELQGGVGDMTATMTNLLDGGWSGQAATAFRAGWDEWLAGAEAVLRALDAAGTALGATAVQYTEQDSLSASTMARLGGGSLMPAYGVDLDQLDAAVVRMARLEQTIEARLADLDARTARLQAEWDGAAADAEAAAHTAWQAGAQQMRDGLTAMKTAASTAHSNYTAAIAANQSMWR